MRVSGNASLERRLRCAHERGPPAAGAGGRGVPSASACASSRRPQHLERLRVRLQPPAAASRASPRAPLAAGRSIPSASACASSSRPQRPERHRVRLQPPAAAPRAPPRAPPVVARVRECGDVERLVLDSFVQEACVRPSPPVCIFFSPFFYLALYDEYSVCTKYI
jgi:hypothetical protein